jgi:excinuclease UvrABC helicase subunit UvrB
MLREAQALNFEKAASLRDRLDEVRLQLAAARNSTPGRRRERDE